MATSWYEKFQEAVMGKLVDMDTDPFRVYLVKGTYTPDYTANEFFDTTTIPTLARGPFITLSGLSIAQGNWGWGSSPYNFVAVPNTEIFTRMIAVWWTGVDSTSRLALGLESDKYGFLPYTGNGNDLPVVFPNTGDKVAAWNR